MKILVAEDSATTRAALALVLRKLGHTCYTACDGAQGWAMFQREPFDVVISDWVMPEMDGLELCRRVRDLADRPYTYLMLVTALEDKQHVLQGMQAGVDDYLTKPVDPEDLRARLIVAQRVSELHRQLAHERSRLRAIVDSSPTGLLLTEGGRPVFWNGALLQLAGITDPAPDALSEQLRATVQNGDELRDILREAVRTGEGASVDLHTTDGRWLELVTFPCGALEGQPSRGYLIRDVTHEREVDRMKSEFVSLASHELRAPLTSIMGFVELLQEPETGPLNDQQAEFLGVVKSGSDRLLALVNDLLDLSRIEAGGLQLERRPVELGPLLADAAAALRVQLAAKEQELAIDLTDPLPCADADPDRVTQVVLNLLSNAHKYTPAGGHIRLAARPAAGSLVEIAVSDSGIGLSPEDQARLFTKFFRSRNPNARTERGTGLGLSICRSLVEMHGGTMSVQSTAGQGSTFSFTLPAVD